MFEEYFRKYRPDGAGSTPRSRIKADKAAVLAMVERESGTVRTSVRKPLKVLRVAAACTAAAACLTVTAGAVTNWSFADAVRSWFGADGAEKTSANLVDVQVSSYVNTCENLDYRFLGAFTDDVFTTLFIEMTRTDGGIFDCSEYAMEGETADGEPKYYHVKPVYHFWADVCPLKKDENGNFIQQSFFAPPVNLSSSQYFIADDDPLDNKMTVAYCVNTKELKQSGGYKDGDTAALNLCLTGIVRAEPICVGTTVRCGEKQPVLDWELTKILENRSGEPITQYMTATAQFSLVAGGSRSAEPDIGVKMRIYEDPTTDGDIPYMSHDFNLKSLSVSSVAISFKLETEKWQENYYFDYGSGLATVNLKDGSSFGIDTSLHNVISFHRTYLAGDAWTMELSFVLDRFIDVNDVVSVEIGGQTIYF